MQDEQKDGHACQHDELKTFSHEVDVIKVSADFHKSKRLLNSEQYRRVLKKGKKLFNPLFLLFILPNNQMQSRLGVTVSKKVSKRAVDRNRIKRQVREFFRLNQNLWQNCDVVLIANPPAAKTENKDIQRELKHIWHKAGQYINR